MAGIDRTFAIWSFRERRSRRTWSLSALRMQKRLRFTPLPVGMGMGFHTGSAWVETAVRRTVRRGRSDFVFNLVTVPLFFNGAPDFVAEGDGHVLGARCLRTQ